MAGTGAKIKVDDGNVEGYDANRYHFDGNAVGVATLDDVGPAEVQQFHDEGYLAVEDAFSSERVDGARNALMELIDCGRGRESDRTPYAIHIEPGHEDKWETLDRDARQDVVRKLMWFVDADARLFEMAHDDKLASVVERLMGGPMKLFQDMALLKPPHGGREKPWHQDHAYFDYELTTKIVGVWIALDEATSENGCMRILPRLHKRDPFVHFKRRDWQICDHEIDELQDRHCLTVPLKPGGCLFFSSLLPHGTPANTSAARRRALQFHYRPLSAISIGEDERMAVFGGEGKDVEC